MLREDLVDGVIDVMLTWSDAHPDVGGRLLADVAADWGVDQKTACRRLMPGGACYFQMHEDDVERVIAHPRSMIGSDGLPHDRHPHPRLWGAFPRVFARYWRERKLFSLEQAVHKMTGMTAKKLPPRGPRSAAHWRVRRRGRLRPDAHRRYRHLRAADQHQRWHHSGLCQRAARVCRGRRYGRARAGRPHAGAQTALSVHTRRRCAAGFNVKTSVSTLANAPYRRAAQAAGRGGAPG